MRQSLSNAFGPFARQLSPLFTPLVRLLDNHLFAARAAVPHTPLYAFR
jgi:hypothetical protein